MSEPEILRVKLVKAYVQKSFSSHLSVEIVLHLNEKLRVQGGLVQSLSC